MGACDFTAVAEGKTAEEAFRVAVDQAKWEHGHGGYTGTIAEKDEFLVVPGDPVPLKDAFAMADKIILSDDGDKNYCDKWGPCGAIELDDGRWLFFGIASS